MRLIGTTLLILLAVACALLAGVSAVLTRNVIEPDGFRTTVVDTLRSPAGVAVVRGAVENEVRARAAAQPAVLAAGAATVAGAWAERALASPAAPRVIGPLAIGLQQGILADGTTDRARIDLRALATAVDPPPAVTALLGVVQGDLLVTVPWVPVAPWAERALRLLDRYRWIPAGLAAAAIGFGILVLLNARRRGLAFVVLGGVLAAGAYLLRPLAEGGAAWFVDPRQPGYENLARVIVRESLDGWAAVSGALIAIGLAIALVGLVLGLRRRSA